MERFREKDGKSPAGQNFFGGGFCGWYFKCQGPGGSLALIPAVHAGGGSLQLITEGESRNVPFAAGQCAVSAARPRAALGQNLFCERGLRLAVDAPGLAASGEVRFGPLSPPAWDVMGPFCAVPFLQCRHRVASMAHPLAGRLVVNGRAFDFDGGRGYIEGDRGRSFPSGYLWTQCLFEGGSLMLAAAQVPLGPAAFRGSSPWCGWRERNGGWPAIWGPGSPPWGAAGSRCARGSCAFLPGGWAGRAVRCGPPPPV